jgi:hypothetical protein
MTRVRGPASLIALLLCVATPLSADDVPTFRLIAKDGRFAPDTIEVPAEKRFRLEITNQNAGPEEFESQELRKELVLAPGVTRTLVFAPLKAGVYPFFGEFHPDTARGRIVAK